MNVSDLIDVLKENENKPKPYDTTAEVVRVEDGTAWVHIPGGEDETPVSMSVSASPGETVRVRVANGHAWITGNDSAPPTDDTTAIRAQVTATTAREYAETAIADAELAHDAALEARASADEAAQAADAAQASANNANEYASRALGNLSTVQSVAETLTWITQHGTMTLTTDISLDPTHVYFVVDPNGDYIVGSTHYSIVAEPDADDLSTYYELSIDESLNNYVGTHLALTNDGLWLLPAASGTYKVLVATGAAGSSYSAGTYIIDSTGATVAYYGTNVQIGKDNESKVVIAPTKFEAKGEIDSYFLIENINGQNTTRTFIADGTINTFTIVNADTVLSAKVAGADAAFVVSTLSASTKGVTVSPYPSAGDTVEITYKVWTTGDESPIYTFGNRDSNYTSGIRSLTEGWGMVASGDYTHAEGYASKATGTYAHAEGYQTESKSFATHTEGRETVASGSYSHAEGAYTEASAIGAHAEGALTVASGTYSHAEGHGQKAAQGIPQILLTASGNASHAEGHATTASGSYSHAEGGNTTASGNWSHAEGSSTVASGGSSHASNTFTIAASESQTAIGRFNVQDSNDTYAFIIGNGLNASSRSNAFTVDWNGNFTFGGQNSWEKIGSGDFIPRYKAWTFSDCNDVDQTGWWFISASEVANGIANFPPLTDGCYFLAFSNGTNYMTQFCFSREPNKRCIFWRSKVTNNGTVQWGMWAPYGGAKTYSGYISQSSNINLRVEIPSTAMNRMTIRIWGVNATAPYEEMFCVSNIENLTTTLSSLTRSTVYGTSNINCGIAHESAGYYRIKLDNTSSSNGNCFNIELGHNWAYFNY